jgi:hypothetical protein
MSNTIEGFKLFGEGQRLAKMGTRAALNEAIDKYKAAYECFHKDNNRAGMGMALLAAGASYSSLGQKRRALESFLIALTYIKQMGDPTFRILRSGADPGPGREEFGIDRDGAMRSWRDLHQARS